MKQGGGKNNMRVKELIEKRRLEKLEKQNNVPNKIATKGKHKQKMLRK